MKLVEAMGSLSGTFSKEDPCGNPNSPKRDVKALSSCYHLKTFITCDAPNLK